MADWIAEGAKAPDFTLVTHDGSKLKLSSLRGTPIVLYFYPKDDTPGCTVETCAFRDLLPKFKPSKAAVFGASILDTKSKAKFADKYDLTFPVDLSLTLLNECKRRGLPVEVGTLPCGHYSTGMAPFKFLDAYVLIRFLKRAL